MFLADINKDRNIGIDKDNNVKIFDPVGRTKQEFKQKGDTWKAKLKGWEDAGLIE